MIPLDHPKAFRPDHHPDWNRMPLPKENDGFSWNDLPKMLGIALLLWGVVILLFCFKAY